MYIIRKENVFWNAESDCWTEAREAATVYEDDLNVPIFLPRSNMKVSGVLDAFGSDPGEVRYYAKNGQCIAKTERVDGGG